MILFRRQLYSELLKLFARPRTYMGFGAFLFFELAMLIMLQLPKAHESFTRSMKMHGLDFSHYFSGLTVAYVMITATVFVLGSVYPALVCGDIVAKEVEDGTMRTVLSRPISRGRILLLKYLTCVVFTFALALFVVVSSLAFGVAFHGLGGLIVVDPWAHVFGFYEAGPGLQRFAYGTLFLSISMLTISNLGFMFSCFNMKPASATVLALSIYLVDGIVHQVPYFNDYQVFFLTHHMGAWTQVFQPTIPWMQLVHSSLYLAAFDLLFLAVGVLNFRPPRL